MKIVNIKISDIQVQHRLWSIDESTVDNLIESIKVIGLKTPISIRKDEYGQYILIAGGHRLEACKKIGFTDIPCVVEDVTEDFATIHEIDENIMRRTITGPERSYQLAKRKEAYERAFNIELSSKASFDRYFKDVDAIVNKGRNRSLYDYTLFTERDLEKEYFKSRVLTNNMEDLFGRFLNKDGEEARHRLSQEEMKIVEKVYCIMVEIGLEINFIDEFITDTAKKTGLDERTIINEVSLGGRITEENLEVIKKAKLPDKLARDILGKKQKDKILEAVNTVVQNEEDISGLDKYIKESFKKARKEVLGGEFKRPSKKENEDINKKAIELIGDFKPVDKSVQNVHTRVNDSDKSDIEKYAEKVAKIFGVTTDKVIIRYEDNEVFINVKR